MHTARHYSRDHGFPYTEEPQKKWAGFSLVAAQACRVLRPAYLRRFGLTYQSAQPLQIHFSHISKNIILAATNCC